MWSRRVFYLGLLVLSILGGVVADTVIVVDGQDPSIRYTTVTNGDNSVTWTIVPRSSGSCDTPQMLTSRVGDYMSFTFTGTGISVVGTLGVKGGIINFALDGSNTTNFDRANPQLTCDAVLFQQLNLPFGQHVVTATLAGREMNPQTGVVDGTLSIQRVRYNIPGSKTSSVRLEPVITAIMAVIVLIAAAGLAYYFWRKRHPIHRYTAVRENDDGGEEEHPMVVLRSQHSTASIRSRHTI